MGLESHDLERLNKLLHTRAMLVEYLPNADDHISAREVIKLIERELDDAIDVLGSDWLD